MRLHMDIHACDVTDVAILGNHSTTQVPFLSHARVYLRPSSSSSSSSSRFVEDSIGLTAYDDSTTAVVRAITVLDAGWASSELTRKLQVWLYYIRFDMHVL
jgi:hypothetical protein